MGEVPTAEVCRVASCMRLLARLIVARLRSNDETCEQAHTGGNAEYFSSWYFAHSSHRFDPLKRCGWPIESAPSTTLKSRSFCRSDRPELAACVSLLANWREGQRLTWGATRCSV